ncbi:MAG: hypothetical protein ABR576_02700 [Thermoanaerobaculia bacterium]
MKRSLTALFCAAALLGAAAVPAAGEKAVKSPPGWERLKTLVGDWEGTYGEKQPVRINYRLVSGGSALMETLHPGGNEPEMVTMYHMDDGRLMMTHYCSEANQPRMRAGAKSADASKLDFVFVDGTNISPGAGHMTRLVVTFRGPNQFEQRWTHAAKGEEHTGLFRFSRKK